MVGSSQQKSSSSRPSAPTLSTSNSAHTSSDHNSASKSSRSSDIMDDVPTKSNITNKSTNNSDPLQRFGYTQNANLVLRAERQTRITEPDNNAEVGSLWGHITAREFGSLVQREKAPISSEKIIPKKTSIINYQGIDDSLEIEELATLKYRPRTIETRTVYEKMLELTMVLSQEVSASIGRDLLDEVLIVLHQQSNFGSGKELEKKHAIESILSLTQPMNSLDYNQIVALSNRLVDYEAIINEHLTMLTTDQLEEEEAFGLTVIEDEDDHTYGDNYLPEIDPGDEETESELILLSKEASQNHQPGVISHTFITDSLTDHHLTKSSVDIRDVDLHFLQRLVSLPDEDAWESHKRANSILTLLNDATLQGFPLEEKILNFLGPRQFEKLSLLVTNRLVITAGVELAGAHGDDERRESILRELIAKGAEGITLATLAQTPRRSVPSSSIFTDEFSSSVNQEMKKTYSKDINITAGKAEHMLAGISRDAMEAQTLASRRIPLPPGSWRSVHAGYEQVTIPGPLSDTSIEVKDAVCLPVNSTLPPWTHPAFAESYDTLNRIQSVVFKDAFYGVENLVISAPTGAGKTGIALLAILKALGSPLEKKNHVNIIVYIAPMRALVTEMASTFQQRLRPLYDPSDLAISELTGETGGGLGSVISWAFSGRKKQSHLLIATPEKWDIVTRKPTSEKILNAITLLIVDEVHLLHDPLRGPTLEALIARSLVKSIPPLRRYIGSANNIQMDDPMSHGLPTGIAAIQSSASLRIVALSATLPNASQVSQWLNAKLHLFGPEWRPCPLTLSFYGFTERKASKRMAMMNDRLVAEIFERIPFGPILVFVHSRRETVRTARFIRDAAVSKGLLHLFVPLGTSMNSSTVGQTQFDTQDLVELVPSGIGVHHAGLSRSDRGIVEMLFASGTGMKLLVSTATLAWGVNLPAHTVIIRGTDLYDANVGGWRSLPSQDVLQMWGRAGRPQFDRNGEALLFTSHENLATYVALAAEPVRSRMLDQLNVSVGSLGSLPPILSHLNAEIVLGNVQCLDDACNWVKERLFLGRMLQDDPTAFGISLSSDNIIVDEPSTDNHNSQLVDEGRITGISSFSRDQADTLSARSGVLDHWIHDALVYSLMVILRDQLGFIAKGSVLKNIIAGTPLGRIASFFYLSPETSHRYANFSSFRKLLPSQGMILEHYAKATELAPLNRIREEERSELNYLMSGIPIPITDKNLKSVILLQAVISRLPLNASIHAPLLMDASQVAMISTRLLRALFEIALVHHNSASVAIIVLPLARAIERRCWSSSSPLMQFLIEIFQDEDLDADVIARIERRELSLSALRALTPIELETLFLSKSMQSIRGPSSSSSANEQMVHGSDSQNDDFGPSGKQTKKESTVGRRSLGKQLAASIQSLPRVQISAAAMPISKDILRLTVVMKPDWKVTNNEHASALFWLLVTDIENEALLYSEQVLITNEFVDLNRPSNGLNQEQQLPDTNNQTSSVDDVLTHLRVLHIPITRPVPPGILIHCLSDKYHHGDTIVPVSFRSLLLPTDEEVPFGRVLELAPVTMSQVRALYHRHFNDSTLPRPTESTITSQGSQHSNLLQENTLNSLRILPSNTQQDPWLMRHCHHLEHETLSPLERYILWLLRLEPDQSLILGLPLTMLGSPMFMERLLEFAAGLATTTVADITNSGTLDGVDCVVNTSIILIASPWRSRRISLGKVLSSLLDDSVGSVHLEDQHPDSDIPSIFSKVLCKYRSTHVIIGSCSFLYQFLHTLVSFTKRSDKKNLHFTVSLILEWGLYSPSQALFQELLLTEIRKYTPGLSAVASSSLNRLSVRYNSELHMMGCAKNMPTLTTSLSLMILPNKLTSLKSLGMWMGANEDRILCFSDALSKSSGQHSFYYLDAVTKDPMDPDPSFYISHLLPFLPRGIHESEVSNAEVSDISKSGENTIVDVDDGENDHYQSSADVTHKSESELTLETKLEKCITNQEVISKEIKLKELQRRCVICTPDIASGLRLARSLMTRLASDALHQKGIPLRSSPDAIASLLNDSEMIDHERISLLAAGIGLVFDPIAAKAFSMALISTIIVPLQFAGDFFATLSTVLHVIIVDRLTTTDEFYGEYAIAMALGISIQPPIYIGSMKRSLVIAGESMLFSSLVTAIAGGESDLTKQVSRENFTTDINPTDDNLDYTLNSHPEDSSTFLQKALDYISQDTWLKIRMEVNPNYYHMADRSVQSLSETLSEALEQAFISDNGIEISLSLGRIAIHYGLGDSLLSIIWPNIKPGIRSKSISSILIASIAAEDPRFIQNDLTAIFDIGSSGDISEADSLEQTPSWGRFNDDDFLLKEISQLGIRILNAIVDVCILKSEAAVDKTDDIAFRQSTAPLSSFTDTTSTDSSTLPFHQGEKDNGTSFLSAALAAMDLCQGLRQGILPRRSTKKTYPLKVFQHQLNISSIEDAELIRKELSIESVYELALYLRSTD